MRPIYLKSSNNYLHFCQRHQTNQKILPQDSYKHFKFAKIILRVILHCPQREPPQVVGLTRCRVTAIPIPQAGNLHQNRLPVPSPLIRLAGGPVSPRLMHHQQPQNSARIGCNRVLDAPAAVAALHCWKRE